MICTKCGAVLADDALYCTNCGEKVFTFEKTEPDPMGDPEKTYEPYERGSYPPPPPPYSYEPPVNDKAPTVKDYLKWILLYPMLTLIPAVGLIAYVVICINHAMDKTNVARSNFFKATLITYLITIVAVAVVAILFFSLFAGLVAGGVSAFEGAYSDIFNEFAYSTMRLFF